MTRSKHNQTFKAVMLIFAVWLGFSEIQAAGHDISGLKDMPNSSANDYVSYINTSNGYLTNFTTSKKISLFRFSPNPKGNQNSDNFLGVPFRGYSSEKWNISYTLSNFVAFNSVISSDQQDTTGIVCPEDIFSYTDVNSCGALISSGLNVEDPKQLVASLSWQMTGATEDASSTSGINQINSYSFNEGTTVITYRGATLYNNSIFCTFTVTVADNQVPNLENPQEDIIVNADAGDCFAVVNWPDPIVSDNCALPDHITVSFSYESGSSFPVGTTVVNYSVGDGVEYNTIVGSFNVTVVDDEVPEFYAPEDFTVSCGNSVPGAYTNWRQFFDAGGIAFDNCNIDYSSFKFTGQKSSGIRCPYTVTRNYSIADGDGNVSEVQHRIYVVGEEDVEVEEDVLLKSAMDECTANYSGNWSVDSIWSCGHVPTSADNVTIPSGITVTVDAASDCDDITITGTLNHSGATTLQVNGDWTNNGTYTSGSGTVEFTGSTDATISGSSSTSFNQFIMNKGADVSSVLEINSSAAVSLGTYTFTSGLLMLTTGNYSLSTAFNLLEPAGIHVNGATLSTGNFSITNEGLIRISSGTANFGTQSGNSVRTQTDGAFEVSGGTVNIAGRLENSAGGYLIDPTIPSGINISGGTINLATVGNGLSSTGALNVTAQGAFSFTGGTITIENANTTGGTAIDLGIADVSGQGTKNITNGVFQIGAGSTYDETFVISSLIPIPNIETGNNANILLANDLEVTNQLTINGTSKILLDGYLAEIPVAPSGSYTFYGEGGSDPITIDFTGGSFSGATITVDVNDSKHPENKNTDYFLNKHWIIHTSGITNPQYNVSATYLAGDIANSATDLIVGNYSSTWSEISGSSVTGNVVSFSFASSNLSFTVMEEPTVDIDNTGPEEICDGSSVELVADGNGDPDITYLWESTPSTTIPSNTSSSVTVSPPANPSDQITNYTYTVTVTDANGFTASDAIGVTVNPNNTVSAASSSPTLCINTALTAITHGTTGATGIGSATGLPNGVSASWVSDEITISGTPTESGMFNYTIPLTGGCGSVDATGTIIVRDVLTPPTISSDQTICYNTVPLPIGVITPASGGSTPYSYQWQESNDNVTWSDIASATTTTYTPSNLTGTTYYRLEVTDAGIPSCGIVYSNVVTIIAEDNIDPSITCPGNLSANVGAGMCGAVVTYITPVGTDNCAVVSTVQTTGLASGETFPVGVTTNTFKVTDAAGNSDSCSFTVTITDNTNPQLTLPGNIPIKCSDSSDPDDTGWATATDICAVDTIFYSDSTGTPAMSCASNYTIYRKWIAEDIYGNQSTDIQEIWVSDAEGPEVVFANQIINVSCPDDIPGYYEDLSQFLASNASNDAYDLCSGSVTMELHDEYSFFDSGSGTAGYCPDSVKRVYRFYDECLYFTDVEQTIFVTDLDTCTCSECTDKVNVHDVDLRADPDSVWVLEKERRDKEARCCLDDEWWLEGGDDPYRCVSFNVIIDDDAVGVQIETSKGQDSKEWRVDCENVPLEGPDGDIICLPSGEYHLFTHCKQGADPIDYIIRSVRGIIESGDISTRVDCSHQIHTTGDFESVPVWSALNPLYDKYLDTSDPYNPIFYVPLEDKDDVPATIQYQVCADVEGYICGQSTDGTICDTITVNVYDPLETVIDLDDLVVCAGTPAFIEPVISPAGEYVVEWFTGTGAIGTPFYTGENYTITTTGWYSVKVTAYESGLPCSEITADFEVEVDLTRPGLHAPPDTLFLNCDDPNADQKIIDWYSTAWGYSVNAYGDTIPVEVTNDYSGINLVCDEVVDVEFKAVDICQNDSIKIATIVVIDTIAPLLTPASDQITDCNTLDKNSHPDYIAWLDSNGGATATDNCEHPDSLEWTNNATDQTWEGDGARDSITVTFYVMDDCGNVAQTKATFTIIDDQPPTIYCPAPVETLIAQDSCSSDTFAIGIVTATDECSVPTLEWNLTGATSGSDTGQVVGQRFNVGVTTVHYTAIDGAGLTDTCSFTVWVKHLDVPIANITCPTDSVWQAADPDLCAANVILGAPVIIDPCNEIDSVWNNSDHRTSASDASGQYPIGTIEFKWFISDVSGNIDSTCTVKVVVGDVDPPQFTSCPADTVAGVIDEDECTVTNPGLPVPEWSDLCGADLSWIVTPITGITPAGSGPDTIPSDYEFHPGQSLITYVLEDSGGNTDTCSFVFWPKHQDFGSFTRICPTDSVWYPAEPDLCAAVVTLDTVEWSDPCYELDSIWNNSFYADFPWNASGTYPIGEYEFKWFIKDLSGNIDSTCTVKVVVGDVDPPQFTSCPADTVAGVIDEDECTVTNPGLPVPEWSDLCGADLSWIVTPITGITPAGSGPDTILSDYEFHPGQSLITYVLEDSGGNTDTCSFVFWPKHQDFGSFTRICPTDSVWYPAEPDLCAAVVTLDTVEWSDPCYELDSIWNNSFYADFPWNASGTYPIGEYEFKWFIKDLSGNIDSTCTVKVVVGDVDPPQFTSCPADTVAGVIDEDECTVTNPGLPVPEWSDLCGADLSWTVTPITGITPAGSGPDTIPSDYEFHPGQSLITYVLEDSGGNTDTCSFVFWPKHQDFGSFTRICPTDSVWYPAEPDLCAAVVTLDTVEWSDPCYELDSIWNNSFYADFPWNASGTYPIGEYEFKWFIKDLSGNIDSTCTVKVVVGDVDPPQFTSCPADTVAGVIDEDECTVTNPGLPVPEWSDLCGADLSWIVTPITGITPAGSGPDTIPSDYEFHPGQSLITYVLEDSGGNTDTCSFIFWPKHQDFGSFTRICPQSVNTWTVNPDSCDRYVPLDTVEWDDPCSELDSIWNNSDYRTSPSDASGTYPIGTTTFKWFIKDLSGNIDSSCTVSVTIEDLPPVLVVPDDTVVQADFDQPYASDIDVELPYFYDNCDSTLTWTMWGVTTRTIGDTLAEDIYVVHSPDTFNLGVTYVEYTFIDGHGNTLVDTFTITVLGAPEIDCPNDTTVTCEQSFDPGIPKLIEGVPPIDWYWTITDELGNVIDADSTIGTTAPSPLPDPIGVVDFPFGVTRITWVAKNISGTDTCWHEITVIDSTPPVFTDTVYENCVDPIHWATYDPLDPDPNPTAWPLLWVDPNLDKYPSLPDFRTFPSGDTSLDLLTLEDNCCDSVDMDIYWEIVFSDTPDPSDPTGATMMTHDTLRGTGQPSTYGSDILLWGDGITFTEVTHEITYWVVDCNDNISQRSTRTIVITPRPEVIKEDY